MPVPTTKDRLATTKNRLGSPTVSVGRIFALVRAVLPIGLGVLLWLTPAKPGALLQLSPTIRLGLAIIFVLYGALRLFRTIRTQFSKPTPDDVD
ncbi:hypothetical protein [Hymenobacter psoromatis]|uniref:hypothetical protein n=1 Tax=Hymenobacter psoromatis TaxID=1484116 RepID=UPI001CBBD9F1|nr:hypothetical protein [Hymenobacter psoromatis]